MSRTSFVVWVHGVVSDDETTFDCCSLKNVFQALMEIKALGKEGLCVLSPITV